MKQHLVSFTMMIFFTLLAFISVSLELSSYFIMPFIFLLAAIQVIFQLYYFMHMKDEGNTIPALFLYSGVFVGGLVIFAFMTIVWW